MKKLIMSCVAFASILSNVNAQPFEARKPVLCDSIESLLFSLSNYNEKPIWSAKNPVDQTRYTLFVNEKLGTWTMLQMNTEGIACIVGVGDGSTLLLGESV